MTVEHSLKTVNPYFNDLWDRNKTFELRKLDRDFQVGDYLILKEYNQDTDSYTGRRVIAQILSILKNVPNYGLVEGYGILSLKIIINQPQ